LTSDRYSLGVSASTVLTIESSWVAASGRGIDDDLVQWPPDVFALTHVVLDRAEAYRFVVSPPAGLQWPPTSSWSEAVDAAATSWRRWTQDQRRQLPDLVLHEWQALRSGATTPLDDVAFGRAWRVITALLTLHAISDQATAYEPRPVSVFDDAGFDAQARQLLARTGSMARLHPGLLRVLPKYRTPARGITSRSIARHAFVAGPAVDVRVNQFGDNKTKSHHSQCNILLLPWPLRVETTDFQPVAGSIHEREIEPYGFFKFDPVVGFDALLADRVLIATAEHAEQVDVVIFPETALREEERNDLEAVLAGHGVDMLVAGMRGRGDDGGELPANWVHFGAFRDAHWTHYRQDKHHRWSLDSDQIAQYHLGAVLDPRVRWWEAMELRRRSLHLFECPDRLSLSALVCEDLAHMDDVADLVRDLGPTLLVTLVLDGPQLASRWTARYASVFADDPGSSVLTLSSYGMVQRSTRAGQQPSSVVALWRDPVTGVHEIALEAGAHALLLTAERTTAIRRAADGRAPELNVSDLSLSKVTQIHAASLP
jgi:hypothetical protein